MSFKDCAKELQETFTFDDYAREMLEAASIENLTIAAMGGVKNDYFQNIIEGVKQKIREEERDAFLERCRLLYDRTENPLFAWDALLCCNEWEMKPPDWVIEYFIECGETLLNFAYEGWPEGTRPKDFIPGALGLSEGQGARSIFKQYNVSRQRLDIYLMVRNVEEEIAAGTIPRQRGRNKFIIAAERIGLSEEYVKEIYYKEKHFF